MPFDWNAVLRETAQHLCRLAADPAFVDHARHRVKQLEPEPGKGLWAGLREEIQRVRQEGRADG